MPTKKQAAHSVKLEPVRETASAHTFFPYVMTTTDASAISQLDDKAAAEILKSSYSKIAAEMGKFIVGQAAVIEELLIAVLAGGHCLLEGVPGLAKTAMVSTLAKTLNMGFRRIQFSPDLMPSDITGTDIIQEDPATGRRNFVFQ